MSRSELNLSTGDAALDAALKAPIRRLRQERKRAMAVIALVILAVVAGLVIVGTSAARPAILPAIGISIYLLFMAPKLIIQRFRRNVSTRVVPHLAEAVGLSYDPKAPDHIAHVVARMFPERTYRTGEDRLTGTLDGHKFEALDLQVRNKTKEQTEIFRGIVVSVSGQTRPNILIVGENMTRDRLFFGPVIDPGSATPIGAIAGKAGASFAAYADGTPEEIERARRFVAALRPLADLDAGVYLRAVTRDFGGTRVALQAGRDLFSLSASFWSDSVLAADLRDILGQMNLVLETVKIIVAAEAAENAPE